MLLVIRLEPLLEAGRTPTTALVVVLIAIVAATRSTEFTSRILKVIALKGRKGRIELLQSKDAMINLTTIN